MEADLPRFDNDSMVVVTKSDVEGYDPGNDKLSAMSAASLPAIATFRRARGLAAIHFRRSGEAPRLLA